ncbi:hypothetical protein [Armatimonas sp.]|uniref:hypothetical protein n=1 Tax=Armatimonas sp. TaxID=1872638 RepID=UPI0037536F7F
MENTHPGHLFYQDQLRQKVETLENLGKIIAIDLDSHDFEIADELLSAGKRLRARHPEARLWCERIGYDAVFALGAGELSLIAK